MYLVRVSDKIVVGGEELQFTVNSAHLFNALAASDRRGLDVASSLVTMRRVKDGQLVEVSFSDLRRAVEAAQNVQATMAA